MTSEGTLVSDMLTTLAWEPHPHAPPAYVLALKQFNKVLINTILALIMLAMGCVVTVEDFNVVLRRPIGAVIGLGCQFLIMPLTGFTLGHLLRLEPAFAIGMLITASSPGGVISSLQTYWSRGDVCLSIVMTTVSTIAALGMLPFNLWLYSRSWTESTQTSIPYSNIIIGLVLIIIPVGVGMVIRWKSAKIARIITKVGSIGGFAMIFMNLAINCIINPRILSSPWTLWLATILLPCCGYTLGYFIALLFCQKGKERRTISFEVGIQNVGVTLSLISVSFDMSPLFFDLITYPSLFGFSLIITSFSLVGFYRVYDKYYPEPEYSTARGDAVDKDSNKTSDASGVFIPTEEEP